MGPLSREKALSRGRTEETARDEERSMSTVAMNQMFRVGVGFAAWCVLRQVLMVWLTYV